jgi:hypothetical protein
MELWKNGPFHIICIDRATIHDIITSYRVFVTYFGWAGDRYCNSFPLNIKAPLHDMPKFSAIKNGSIYIGFKKDGLDFVASQGFKCYFFKDFIKGLNVDLYFIFIWRFKYKFVIILSYFECSSNNIPTAAKKGSK